MKGLFEKDLRILLQRKQALVLFVLIALVFGYTMDGSFIMSYLSFLCMIMATGTISYDEMDNGLLFLMTLPIDIKTYVKEKYMFCMGCGALSWIFSIVLYVGMAPIKGESVQGILPLVSFLLIPIVFGSLIIPIQLKYGIEKSRIVLCTVACVISAICFGIAKVIPVHIIHWFMNYFSSMNPYLLGCIGWIVTIGIVFVSYKSSCRIMKCKQY